MKKPLTKNYKLNLFLDILAWAAAILLTAFLTSNLIPLWQLIAFLITAALMQAVLGLSLGLYSENKSSSFVKKFYNLILIVVVVALIYLLIKHFAFSWSTDSDMIVYAGMTAIVLMIIVRMARVVNIYISYLPQKKLIQRYPIVKMHETAEKIIAKLNSIEAVTNCSVCGSMRRMKEVIGDLDVIVACENIDEVIKCMVDYLKQDFHKITVKSFQNPKRVKVFTSDKMKAEIFFVTPQIYASALQYFTGSVSHNILLRWYALKKGYKFSWAPNFHAEGIRNGIREAQNYFTTKRGESITGVETEGDIYADLGLQWIPPPLREGRREIRAARKGMLPKLVELPDIKGDLRCYLENSKAGPGIEAFARAVIERGYEYIVIMANLPVWEGQGIDCNVIAGMCKKIEEVKREFSGRVHILRGIETFIEAEGGLSYPEDILEGFDVVVALMKDNLEQSRVQVTRRLLMAIEHPRVNIIANPTGRLINERGPRDFDFNKICRAAEDNCVALEINAQPRHLDLPGEYVRRAKRHKVCFAVSTASSRPEELSCMRYGVGMAQRGWATREDIINTWPLEKLEKFFGKLRL